MNYRHCHLTDLQFSRTHVEQNTKLQNGSNVFQWHNALEFGDPRIHHTVSADISVINGGYNEHMGQEAFNVWLSFVRLIPHGNRAKSRRAYPPTFARTRDRRSGVSPG